MGAVGAGVPGLHGPAVWPAVLCGLLGVWGGAAVVARAARGGRVPAGGRGFADVEGAALRTATADRVSRPSRCSCGPAARIAARPLRGSAVALLPLRTLSDGTASATSANAPPARARTPRIVTCRWRADGEVRHRGARDRRATLATRRRASPDGARAPWREQSLPARTGPLGHGGPPVAGTPAEPVLTCDVTRPRPDGSNAPTRNRQTTRPSALDAAATVWSAVAAESPPRMFVTTDPPRTTRSRRRERRHRRADRSGTRARPARRHHADRARERRREHRPAPGARRAARSRCSRSSSPILDGGIRLGDPYCVAHLHPAPLIAAAAAELAIGVTNQSMDAFDASPAATFVEDALVTRLAQLHGLPHGSGVMTMGGTASNLLGLLLARDRAGDGRPRARAPAERVADRGERRPRTTASGARRRCSGSGPTR